MVVKEIPYFDLSEICDSGQCFRMERITENEFQIRAEDKYLRATQEGETVRFDCSEEEFETFWKHYFDLERDYGIYIEAIDPEDTYLKTAAEAWKAASLDSEQDLWEMIVSVSDLPAEQHLPHPKMHRPDLKKIRPRKKEPRTGPFIMLFRQRRP